MPPSHDLLLYGRVVGRPGDASWRLTDARADRAALRLEFATGLHLIVDGPEDVELTEGELLIGRASRLRLGSRDEIDADTARIEYRLEGERMHERWWTEPTSAGLASSYEGRIAVHLVAPLYTPPRIWL